MRVLWVLLLMLAIALTPAVDASAMRRLRTAAEPAQTGCDAFAAPQGSPARSRKWRGRLGSWANPFNSPQSLVNSLHAGQTGCLESGTYDLGGELTFNHTGEPNAPITLRSVRGRRATLVGGPLYIPQSSDNVQIEHVNINTGSTDQVGIQVMSVGDALIGDNITNRSAPTSCIILGSNGGWGVAVDTIIADDVIHQCGSPSDGDQDHAIYFNNSDGAVVRNSEIWGTSGFAIHLYEHAINTVVRHNVIDDNGYGVIFSDGPGFDSWNNVVVDNVIADTTHGYGVESWWGGSVGEDNVLEHNCIYDAAKGAISRPTSGFTAIDNVVAPRHFTAASQRAFAMRRGSACSRVVGFDAAVPDRGAARRSR